MGTGTTHKWTFRTRFRKRAFGWRSQPAVKRVKEAVAEIKKVARKDPVLGAEGAVIFFEKVSPALEQVDGSSGAITTVVNHAIETLVPIITEIQVSDDLRSRWLERLWRAVEEDAMPYIELLPDYWGEICATPERASQWADEFIGVVRMAWSPNPELRGYFSGTTACLSSLLKAGRNEELLELLALAPFKSWSYRKWGVQALVAMGRKADAMRYCVL